jgi:hypothetical protein
VRAKFFIQLLKSKKGAKSVSLGKMGCKGIEKRKKEFGFYSADFRNCLQAEIFQGPLM